MFSQKHAYAYKKALRFKNIITSKNTFVRSPCRGRDEFNNYDKRLSLILFNIEFGCKGTGILRPVRGQSGLFFGPFWTILVLFYVFSYKIPP